MEFTLSRRTQFGERADKGSRSAFSWRRSISNQVESLVQTGALVLHRNKHRNNVQEHIFGDSKLRK